MPCHSGAVDLNPYVAALGRELLTAVETGGDDASAVVERLTASMESAIRLALLEALSAAADEITRELAPGAVELRLRSGTPEFVVTSPDPDDDVVEPQPQPDFDEGEMTRINLRLPEPLKAAAEQAASRERLSVNAWLVRALAAALAHDDRDRPRRRGGGRIGEAYTGWAR
jgi:HicB family